MKRILFVALTLLGTQIIARRPAPPKQPKPPGAPTTALKSKKTVSKLKKKQSANKNKQNAKLPAPPQWGEMDDMQKAKPTPAAVPQTKNSAAAKLPSKLAQKHKQAKNAANKKAKSVIKQLPAEYKMHKKPPPADCPPCPPCPKPECPPCPPCECPPCPTPAAHIQAIPLAAQQMIKKEPPTAGALAKPPHKPALGVPPKKAHPVQPTQKAKTVPSGAPAKKIKPAMLIKPISKDPILAAKLRADKARLKPPTAQHITPAPQPKPQRILPKPPPKPSKLVQRAPKLPTPLTPPMAPPSRPTPQVAPRAPMHDKDMMPSRIPAPMLPAITADTYEAPEPYPMMPDEEYQQAEPTWGKPVPAYEIIDDVAEQPYEIIGCPSTPAADTTGYANYSPEPVPAYELLAPESYTMYPPAGIDAHAIDPIMQYLLDEDPDIATRYDTADQGGYLVYPAGG